MRDNHLVLREYFLDLRNFTKSYKYLRALKYRAVLLHVKNSTLRFLCLLKVLLVPEKIKLQRARNFYLRRLQSLAFGCIRKWKLLQDQNFYRLDKYFLLRCRHRLLKCLSRFSRFKKILDSHFSLGTVYRWNNLERLAIIRLYSNIKLLKHQHESMKLAYSHYLRKNKFKAFFKLHNRLLSCNQNCISQKFMENGKNYYTFISRNALKSRVLFRLYQYAKFSKVIKQKLKLLNEYAKFVLRRQYFYSFKIKVRKYCCKHKTFDSTIFLKKAAMNKFSKRITQSMSCKSDQYLFDHRIQKKFVLQKLFNRSRISYDKSISVFCRFHYLLKAIAIWIHRVKRVNCMKLLFIKHNSQKKRLYFSKIKIYLTCNKLKNQHHRTSILTGKYSFEMKRKKDVMKQFQHFCKFKISLYRSNLGWKFWRYLIVFKELKQLVYKYKQSRLNMYKALNVQKTLQLQQIIAIIERAKSVETYVQQQKHDYETTVETKSLCDFHSLKFDIFKYLSKSEEKIRKRNLIF